MRADEITEDSRVLVSKSHSHMRLSKKKPGIQLQRNYYNGIFIPYNYHQVLYTVNFSAEKISILVRCTIWDTKFSRAWTFFQNSLMHHSRFKIEASTQKNSGPIWHHLNYFQGLLWRLYKNDQLGIESCENHDWKSWISLLSANISTAPDE